MRQVVVGLFVALLVAMVMCAGCAHGKPAPTPATCGAGWASLGAFALPEVDASPTVDRAETGARTIAEVRIVGVDAALAGTLHAALETSAGQVLADAPIAADLRRLWALGVIDDARIEIEGDRIAFVLTPRPRIGRVVITRRDPQALRRFDLLAGATYEPQRIARIAAAVKLNYVRDGYLDARVDVSRWQRANSVDVCVAAAPGPKVTIGSIAFPGRRKVPAATLIGALHGAKSGINTVGGLLDMEALDFDKAFLLAEYWELGHANVSIGAIRTQRRGDKIDVEIPIDEGAVFTLGTLELRLGDQGIVPPPRIAIPLAYGEVFKRSRVADARLALEVALGADVLPLTHVDEVHHRIDITFEITGRFPWDALRLWLLP